MLGTVVFRSVLLLVGGIAAMVAFQQIWPDVFRDDWRPSKHTAARAGGSIRAASLEARQVSEPMDRDSAESAPAREISVRAGANGHYLIQTEIEGATVNFVVDTGATLIVLSPADAEKIGIDPSALDYDSKAESANGVVAVARVVLPEVRVGQLVIRDVEAMVNSAPMPISLLGNSFLGRLESYEVVGDRLVMRW